MSDLFRQEAIRHASRRLEGEVVIATPIRMAVLAALLVGVIILGAVFAATATYSRKETISGWLTPRAGLIRLSARQGGLVRELHVREGQQVAIGQSIATVTLSTTLETGDSFSSLARSLDAQKTAAGARAGAQVAVLQAEREQLQHTRRGLEAELTESRRQLEFQKERLEISRSEVARAESIAAQGFMPQRELEARRAAELESQQATSAQTTQVLALERQIGEIQGRLNAIPLSIRATEAEGASDLASLDEQSTQTEAQATYVVVATVAGHVAALPVETGQTLRQGATIAVLTPGTGSDLEVELYAPSTAIGFIRPGQDVNLMYRAFPHQKFGSGVAVVRSVSETILAPDEVTIPGLQVQEPVFRIRARLRRSTIDAYGETIPLKPGMLVNADVVIDRRSLLEWLLDPLYAAGRRR